MKVVEVETANELGVGEGLVGEGEDLKHPVEGGERLEHGFVPEKLDAALAPRFADAESGGEGGGGKEAEDVEEDFVR